MNEPTPSRTFAPSHVAVYCRDRPDSQGARKAAAQAHLRYVDSILGHIALAGPLFTEDGLSMTGSFYVFRTTNLDEARRWLEADPYFAAGFWATVEYRPFLPAAGEFVGGTIW